MAWFLPETKSTVDFVSSFDVAILDKPGAAKAREADCTADISRFCAPHSAPAVFVLGPANPYDLTALAFAFPAEDQRPMKGIDYELGVIQLGLRDVRAEGVTVPRDTAGRADAAWLRSLMPQLWSELFDACQALNYPTDAQKKTSDSGSVSIDSPKP